VHHAGNVLLMVNVVSKCALTPQYDGLEAIYSKISVRGEDIHPLYAGLTAAKPSAVGDGPMIERLAGQGIPSGRADEVVWNFEKFLVGRDAQVIDLFAPVVDATDPRLVGAVDAALPKG
jgi:glutathione peroxidase